MKSFYDQEQRCSERFALAGDFWHLWTPESYELIFTDETDFKAAMFVIGFAVASHPCVRLVTFQVMSNHFHFTMCGNEEQVLACFGQTHALLSKYFDKIGRKGILKNLQCKHRIILSLQDARNVVVYNNRNGYLVHPEYSPFSFPWGANSFYYSPFAMKYYEACKQPFTARERRSIICSHAADNINSIMKLDGIAAPPSFCDIALGESLFRDSSHYFHLISRSIESQKEIANMIGESIFYTDDELFRMLSSTCKNNYKQAVPSLIPSDAKIEMARMLRYDYNASDKQIIRMLKVDSSVLAQFVSPRA